MSTEKSDNIEKDLDELLVQLQNNPPSGNNQVLSNVTSILNTTTKSLITNPELEEYINEKIQKINDVLLNVIIKYANDIDGDPEKLDSFSNLINSNTKLLDLINKRIIKSKDNDTKKEIQTMKSQTKLLKDLKEGDSIVASRDEIFNQIIKSAKEESIDIIESTNN